MQSWKELVIQHSNASHIISEYVWGRLKVDSPMTGLLQLPWCHSRTSSLCLTITPQARGLWVCFSLCLEHQFPRYSHGRFLLPLLVSAHGIFSERHFFFPLTTWHVEQRSNLGPLHWKHRVLTTGPPGNSLRGISWFPHL